MQLSACEYTLDVSVEASDACGLTAYYWELKDITTEDEHFVVDNGDGSLTGCEEEGFDISSAGLAVGVYKLKVRVQDECTNESYREYTVTVEAGKKIGVIGPSGSGKTTLLNLVAGILTPGKGSVKVDNLEISKQNDKTRRDFRITNIGFIFQDFGLLDYLDVKNNILHPYRITGALKLNNDVRDRADMLAEQMGI